jgi:hypothetical protein
MDRCAKRSAARETHRTPRTAGRTHQLLWSRLQWLRMGKIFFRSRIGASGRVRLCSNKADAASLKIRSWLPINPSSKSPPPDAGTRNITAVARAVAEFGIQTGLVHVFVQHTSCSLGLTENADLDVRRDLEGDLVAPCAVYFSSSEDDSSIT